MKTLFKPGDTVSPTFGEYSGYPGRVKRVTKRGGEVGCEVRFPDNKERFFHQGDLEEAKPAACHQCQRPMNPVDAIMGSVCGKCAAKNHARVRGMRVGLT
jgi:hypothetical protein